MAFRNTVTSWLMMVSSRLSFWTFMPVGRMPMIATSAKPITARLIAISIMVKAERGEGGWKKRSPRERPTRVGLKEGPDATFLREARLGLILRSRLGEEMFIGP